MRAGVVERERGHNPEASRRSRGGSIRRGSRRAAASKERVEKAGPVLVVTTGHGHTTTLPQRPDRRAAGPGRAIHPGAQTGRPTRKIPAA